MGPKLKQGKVDLARLIARVREEFPGLAFDRGVLDDQGEDHAVVILDESWVFRFPRTEAAARLAGGERRLLEQLSQGSPLATPRYELISARGDFAGYPMILGSPLSEGEFAALSCEAQERIMDELGRFLACLHALPTELVDLPEGPRAHGLTGAQAARHYRQRRKRLATALPAALLGPLDQFYEALPASVDGAPKVLIHGDLSEDHILLAPGGERLAGVIDFTAAGAGDPAFDFTFLWAYGDWAPARALGRYGKGEATGKLLERSRAWWTRYSVDRLWWALSGARAYDRQKVVEDIRSSLGALGF